MCQVAEFNRGVSMRAWVTRNALKNYSRGSAFYKQLVQRNQYSVLNVYFKFYSALVNMHQNYCLVPICIVFFPPKSFIQKHFLYKNIFPDFFMGVRQGGEARYRDNR